MRDKLCTAPLQRLIAKYPLITTKFCLIVFKNIVSMTATQKSVLITGCSAGGIGSALAELFHRRGWLVFATARELSKVQNLKLLGCEIILLDVTIDETISAAVKVVESRADGKLDMLINNAGFGMNLFLF
jgi:NAD(P)-dependent dehydrogenase (short-subunit alcohol dehydrogenase family)